MAPETDPDAVVDQYGKVYGVDGLRLADTSILPDVPSRGPAATAILIGERVADFVRTGAGSETGVADPTSEASVRQGRA
jgi:choline dehydrogenase